MITKKSNNQITIRLDPLTDPKNKTDAVKYHQQKFLNNIKNLTQQSQQVKQIWNNTCSNNKFIVYLPYFGRAYSATFGSSQGPLDFTTSDFDIAKEEKKTGQWSLVLKPKDNKEIQSMNFTLYDNGAGDLNVTFTNRSPISFRGNVTPKK